MTRQTGPASPVEIGQMQVAKHELDLEWKIPNFFSYPEGQGLFYNGPSFLFMDSLWRFRVYPNGMKTGKEISRKYVTLYLLKLGESRLTESLMFTFGIKTVNGEIRQELAKKFFSGLSVIGGSTFFSRTILLNRKSEISIDGAITFTCHLENKNPFPSGPAPKLRNASIDKLLQDLESLLLDEETSDATVRVKGGQDFRVHRNILRARNPVFRAMFSHEMSEKTSGTVNIGDCTPDTFGRFLHYLYTSDVLDLTPKRATALYDVADKYQVEELKSFCLQYIGRTLSVDSFCDVVTLAMNHNERELLNSAKIFFTEKVKQIIPTAKWQSFLSENPIEANDLLVRALGSYQNVSDVDAKATPQK